MFIGCDSAGDANHKQNGQDQRKHRGRRKFIRRPSTPFAIPAEAEHQTDRPARQQRDRQPVDLQQEWLRGPIRFEEPSHQRNCQECERNVDPEDPPPRRGIINEGRHQRCRRTRGVSGDAIKTDRHDDHAIELPVESRTAEDDHETLPDAFDELCRRKTW